MTSLGIVLLVLGALVAVAEAHYPTHGIAGGVGVVVLAVGAVLAISGLGAGILLGLLGGAVLAGIGGGALAVSLKHGTAVRHQLIRSGPEAMIGHVGVVRDWSEVSGSVALDGALWSARRSTTLDEDDDEIRELHAGDPVVVERLNGLTLCVRPAEEWELL